MRKCSIFIICLVSFYVFPQSNGETSFSFDVGVTNFTPKTLTDDVLTPLGYENREYTTTLLALATPYIGANLRRNDWVLGLETQMEHLHEIDVKTKNDPYIDRFGTTTSWVSAYVERHFKVRENFHPFLTVGVSHTKTRGFARVSGEIARDKFEKTEPLVGIGLSLPFKKATFRYDVTKRFTDDPDTSNLFRFAVRYPFR